MMGTIADALTWSGSGATLSLFVVSNGSLSFDPGTLSLEPPPIRVRTYSLDDEGNLQSVRHVLEYDLYFAEVPPNLEELLTRCLRAARASGASVAWFGFEGSFDFACLLSPEIANQIYAVMDSEGVALASDAMLSSKVWVERIVRAGERARGD
ncbi:MAG TPA: hypothetical protein VLC09_21225 [Polyangiaceae bacterium]|nr:hypothetical protein [Polyangiaceae bacterium]